MNCKEKKEYEDRIYWLQRLHKAEAELFALRIGELGKKIARQQEEIKRLEDMKLEQMKESARLAFLRNS